MYILLCVLPSLNKGFTYLLTNVALLKVPMIPAGVLKVFAPLTVEITVANDVSIGGNLLTATSACRMVPSLPGFLLLIKGITNQAPC